MISVHYNPTIYTVLYCNGASSDYVGRHKIIILAALSTLFRRLGFFQTEKIIITITRHIVVSQKLLAVSIRALLSNQF